MKIHPLLCSLLLSLPFVGPRLTADEVTTQAKVISVEGPAAQVQIARGAQRALQPGESLPQGATIVTGADTIVLIAPFEGAVTSVQANSQVSLEKLSVTADGGKVTRQTALLDVKSGVVASVLDPLKRAINDFSVRGPNGIAKAQGTTFAIEVNGMKMQVTTGNGQVTFTPVGAFATTYTVKGGQMLAGSPPSVVDATPGPTLDLVMGAIANTAAKVAADPAKYGVDPATAQSELTDTITTLVQAAPSSAGVIVASAVRAVPVHPGEVNIGIYSPLGYAIAQAGVKGIKGLSGNALQTAASDLLAGLRSGLSQNVAAQGVVNPSTSSEVAASFLLGLNTGVLDANQSATVQTVLRSNYRADTTPVTSVDARILSPSGG